VWRISTQMKAKICFIVDATGSMEMFMASTANKVQNIAEAVKMTNLDMILEVAAVFYRDFGNKNQYEIIPFTENIEGFITAFKNVEAEGGDDICEDVAGGFRHMLDLDWSGAAIRNVFLVCDAPPHGLEWHTPECNDNFKDNDFNLGSLIKETQNRNIILTVMRTSGTLNTMIVKMKEIIPTMIVVDTIPTQYGPPFPLRRHIAVDPQANRVTF